MSLLALVLARRFLGGSITTAASSSIPTATITTAKHVATAAKKVKMEWTTEKVRESFIKYFTEHKDYGHTFWPSSSTVPHNDPTILFANAGMNQYKPLFLGTFDPNSDLGKLKAAANSQKCIRAGGKHNDLDDVGKDVYHHTFFEMLGNWSFNGTFFKKEAIAMAWNLLTKVWGLERDRLYVTYFEGDESEGLEPDYEARDFWREMGLDDNRILPGNKADNFWEMGETGPCGPCSEIHYDRIGNRFVPELVNADDPDVLELWNLVFMQFNRGETGELKKLPNVHVDTGLGLERVVSVLQNKRSNYDTDAFTPFFEAIERGSKAAHPYSGKVGAEDVGMVDTAYRVLADHIRTLTIAIVDGGMPDNVGRGYILRLILRRAIRFGDEILGAPPGLFPSLAPIVQQTLGGHFKELTDEKIAFVMEVLTEEEETFRKTLERGRKLFERAASNMKGTVFDGNTTWKLWDTFGFPVDLTKVMCEERGLTIDMEAFEAAKERARKISMGVTNDGEKKVTMDVNAIGDLRVKEVPATNDEPKYVYTRNDSGKYEFPSSSGSILAIRALDDSWAESANGGDVVGLVLDQTNFYAEQGGQIYDRGFMSTEDGNEFIVQDVQKAGPYCLHIGELSAGSIKIGDKLQLTIDETRRRVVMSNHTCTHVLNLALRKVLGEADQKGSLVEPDRFRFDFTAKKALTSQQVADVEVETNAEVEKDAVVYDKNVSLADARSIEGLRAMFGEEYPDPVRLVTVGVDADTLMSDPASGKGLQHSVEFCGGTHVRKASDIGPFALISEEAIAKGIRRVVCVTGNPAIQARKYADRVEAMISDDLDKAGLNDVKKALLEQPMPAPRREQIRTKIDVIAKKLLAKDKEKTAKLAQVVVARANEIVAEKPDLVVEVIAAEADVKALGQGLQVIKKKSPTTVTMFISPNVNDQVVQCNCVVPKAIAKEKGLSAKAWIESIAGLVGGKVGGSNEVAQIRGDNPEKIAEALEVAREYASSKLA
jgi:alanyl-tRNA synthetase